MRPTEFFLSSSGGGSSRFGTLRKSLSIVGEIGIRWSEPAIPLRTNGSSLELGRRTVTALSHFVLDCSETLDEVSESGVEECDMAWSQNVIRNLPCLDLVSSLTAGDCTTDEGEDARQLVMLSNEMLVGKLRRRNHVDASHNNLRNGDNVNVTHDLRKWKRKMFPAEKLDTVVSTWSSTTECSDLSLYFTKNRREILNLHRFIFPFIISIVHRCYDLNITTGIRLEYACE